MKVVGITGLRRSGKSTVAMMLRAHGYVELCFADPLKKGVQAMFDLTDEQLDTKKEELDPFWNTSPRELLQVIGTDLIREQLPQKLQPPSKVKSVWIQCMEKRLLNTSADKVVIPDVRFPDELSFLKQMGSEIIHVTRPGAVPSIHNHHSSEAMASNVEAIQPSVVFCNDGTIDDLHDKVAKWLIHSSVRG